MEYKHISKIVHLYTCNLTDILVDNENKFCLINENSITSSSLNEGGVWFPRVMAKMMVSWHTWIMIGDLKITLSLLLGPKTNQEIFLMKRS